MADGIEIGTAYLSITPSAAGFGSKLQQLITPQAGLAGQQAGKALGDGITGQASGIATKVAGVFAAIGVARFLKGSVAEAEDAARVGRLTEAVIRSTGGAANVSAGQVEQLASSLSKVAGVDDELVQAGANVLLTFTKVRNEVGRGNDVFDQTAKAALDMSAALGGDLQGSVLQLGKALNDPVAGMTALTRSGVSFTAQQKEQIKALAQSGDLLSAQKLILAEVNQEFGGAAAANATATARLGVAVGNLQESLGTVLLPAVEGAAGALTGLVGGFTSLPGPVQAATAGLILVGGGVTAAGLAFGILAPKIRLARLELAGLGTAGAAANAGLGIAARGLGLAGLLLGLAQLGPLVKETLIGSTSIGELGEAITLFARQRVVDGELLARFGADIDAVAESLTGVKYGRRSGFLGETFDRFSRSLTGHSDDWSKATERIDSLDSALADLVKGGNAAGAEEFVATLTAALAAQGANVPEIIGKLDGYRVALENLGGAAPAVNGVTVALGLNGDTAEEAAAKWKDLRVELDALVATGWSTQLASDLGAALNPLERFVAGAADIDDLKASVTSATTELTKAKADLAKLDGSGTAAEIARLRGNATDIDEVRGRVDQATRRLGDANRDLADAQKTPLTSIRENLTANVALLTGWLANITGLSARGHESLAKHLAALGPEAAGAAAEAAGLSPKQLTDLEGLFGKRDKLVADAASGTFELNLDLAGRPGVTAAEIFVQRYEETLQSKLPPVILGALSQAMAALSSWNPAAQAAAAGISSGVAGAMAHPGIAPTAVLGPPVPLPGGAPVLNTTVNVQSGAEPAQIAAEIGDVLAWRLVPALGR